MSGNPNRVIYLKVISYYSECVLIEKELFTDLLN